MQYKIGKVRNYDKGAGDIVTPEKKYLFLDTDVVYDQDDDKIVNEDVVIFGDEGKERAFFVKKIKRKPITLYRGDKEVK